MESWYTVQLNTWVWAGVIKPVKDTWPLSSTVWWSTWSRCKKKKKKILQHRQGCVSPEEELKLSWSFIFIVHNGKRYRLTATSNQPVSSWRPKKFSSNSTQVFHPFEICFHLQKKKCWQWGLRCWCERRPSCRLCRCCSHSWLLPLLPSRLQRPHPGVPRWEWRQALGNTHRPRQSSRSPSCWGWRRHWGPGSCPCTPGWTRGATTAGTAETCPVDEAPPGGGGLKINTWYNSLSCFKGLCFADFSMYPVFWFYTSNCRNPQYAHAWPVAIKKNWAKH